MRKQPDLREQANKVSGHLAAELSPELMTMIRDIGNSIAASLGESPERWIGAVKLVQAIIDPLTDPLWEDDALVRSVLNITLAELTTRPAGVMALEAIWKEAIDGASTESDA